MRHSLHWLSSLIQHKENCGFGGIWVFNTRRCCLAFATSSLVCVMATNPETWIAKTVYRHDPPLVPSYPGECIFELMGRWVENFETMLLRTKIWTQWRGMGPTSCLNSLKLLPNVPHCQTSTWDPLTTPNVVFYGALLPHRVVYTGIHIHEGCNIKIKSMTITLLIRISGLSNSTGGMRLILAMTSVQRHIRDFKWSRRTAVWVGWGVFRALLDVPSSLYSGSYTSH